MHLCYLLTHAFLHEHHPTDWILFQSCTGLYSNDNDGYFLLCRVKKANMYLSHTVFVVAIAVVVAVWWCDGDAMHHGSYTPELQCNKVKFNENSMILKNIQTAA